MEAPINALMQGKIGEASLFAECVPQLYHEGFVTGHKATLPCWLSLFSQLAAIVIQDRVWRATQVCPV
jgi:hypothetical protein